MNADLAAMSKDSGLVLNGTELHVDFRNGRGQRVFVGEERDGSIRLWSIVAAAALVGELDAARLRAWQRNRLMELVGFSVDSRGRMIGELWVPEVGLSAEEWGFCVRYLAKACDIFEHVLTGRDRH